jgi:hypothetical protein
MSDTLASPAPAPKPTVDDIIASRRQNRYAKGAFYALLLIMVVWSIKVTVIEDTDWERIGSVGKVIEAANRFIGIDFSLFPSLIGPAIMHWLAAT